MTREELIAKWTKIFKDTLIPFPEEIYDYMAGKIEYPAHKESGFRRTGYVYIADQLLKELDGDNAETARRILMLITKISKNGMFTQNYSLHNQIPICLRIGYPFADVANEYLKVGSSDVAMSSIYNVARAFVEHDEEASSRLADYLTDEAHITSWKGRNKDVGLGLFIGLLLLEKDATKYARYRQRAIEVTRLKGNRFVLAMMYYGYRVIPELRPMLIGQLTENASTISTFVYYALDKLEQFPPLLHDLQAPLWPYYAAVANQNRDIDPIPIFKKLYAEDKATFIETYRQLSKNRVSSDAANALPLLSILLRHGEATAELQAIEPTLVFLMRTLINSSTKRQHKDEPGPDDARLKDPATPTEDWRKWVGNLDTLYYNSLEYIGKMGLLYDHSPLAKRFIDALLLHTRSANYGYNNACVAYRVISNRKAWNDISQRESMQMLLQTDNEYGLPQAFATFCRYADKLESVFSAEDIHAHEAEALEVLTNGSLDIEHAEVWMSFLYETCGIQNDEPLLTIFADKSKRLRKKAEAIGYEREATIRPLLEQRKGTLKGEAALIAKRLIKRWDNERKFGTDFSFTPETVSEYCRENYDPDMEKFIAWIPQDMLTGIRFADLTGEAPDVVMKVLLSEYLSQEEAYRIRTCDKIVQQLHPQDLQAALENIYQFWKEKGAEAKKKMILLPYCMYASDSQILRMKAQLKEWTDASRGAIAAFAVNAMAMNGGSVALMIVDGLTTKAPNNQVKNAAKAAFAFAAKAMEVPEDELSDKIVPTLGFSQSGEKVFDYGERTFTATLMPDFELTLFDNDKQKTVKSLPAPAASDDAIKAAAAKKEFSELKKQIKATVKSQSDRLEKVLMNGRTWTVEAWEELFVKNPIMHHFAMRLIWGVYADGHLKDSFRYMEDGTFNTVDEEEYTLPEKATITLIHPIDTDEEMLARWKEQLDDYEIIQPLPQLSAPIVRLEAKDVDNKKVTRYNGLTVKAGKISSLAKKYNMQHGEVWDAGSYTCFHWTDSFLNIGILLNFEYMYMGQDFDEEVTLGDVLFYPLDEDGRPDDEPKQLLDPNTLPPRLVSTVLGVFDAFNDK